MRKNTLICENLFIVHENEIILKNVSFSLMPGSYVELDGENGSGKTSLLRSIARLSHIESGTITYNNCNVDEFLNEYKQIILYISDKDQLNTNMTVYETLDFWSGLYSSEMVLPAAAHTFGLTNYIEYKIKALSKGLKKRVVLSRLLLQKSRIWLLDEPFVNLDSESVNLMQNIIATHIGNGGIVIISNHMKNKSHLEAIAELQNIGYKNNNSSQLEKNLLKMQDFKL